MKMSRGELLRRMREVVINRTKWHAPETYEIKLFKEAIRQLERERWNDEQDEQDL